MIKVFFGDDRVRAKEGIEKFLGADYEVIDSEGLDGLDLSAIFLGKTLFSDTRSILLRDFLVRKDLAEKLPEYLGTPHKIAIFEQKLDKRSVIYKDLKDKIEFLEYKLPEKPRFFIFDVYKMAKTDGKKAVEMLRTVEDTEEPMMCLGAFVSSAVKDFAARPNDPKNKMVLKELSELDMNLKTTGMDAWKLIEAFLVNLA